MKKYFVIIFLSIFLLIGFFMMDDKSEEICSENSCFKVEIAETDEERTEGLMFREFLGKDEGMFFVFEKSGIYPFWMKNTLIPLDIVWLDEEMEIVFIKINALPCGNEICESVNPDILARYVLEVNSGMVEKNNISIGDVMKWRKNTLF